MLSKNSTSIFRFQIHLLQNLKVACVIMSMRMIFFQAWESMLDKHGLQENSWLKFIFEVREKWAMVYGRNHFCANMTTTQLSESFNSRLRHYLKSTNNVLEFFSHFERLLEDLRHNELDSNYDMSQRLPVLRVEVLLLKNSRDVYTPKIFNFFQEEYKKSLDMVVNTCYDISPLFEYKVCMYGCTREHKVIFNSTDQTVVCSCNKFEFAGFLCSHALKVLDIQNIKLLPSRYILKRWTKQARVGCVLDSYGCIVKEDPKLDITNRYKDLCRNAVNIASKAAETEEASMFLAKKMVELNLDVERILKKKNRFTFQ